ncbi:MAG: hypothetical protein O3B95_10150, partial [Chloroflexi bacterium]|nr:hypothetical protein [Chloroflexota bacterium]
MDPRFENLAGYVLDALDSDSERAEVQALIETDRAVQAEYDELAETAGILANAVPPTVPPARLKTRILEMAAADSISVGTGVRRPAVLPSTVWWARAARSTYVGTAAAAVLILIVAGTLGYQNNSLGNEIDSLRIERDAEAAEVDNLRAALST